METKDSSITDMESIFSKDQSVGVWRVGRGHHSQVKWTMLKSRISMNRSMGHRNWSNLTSNKSLRFKSPALRPTIQSQYQKYQSYLNEPGWVKKRSTNRTTNNNNKMKWVLSSTINSHTTDLPKRGTSFTKRKEKKLRLKSSKRKRVPKKRDSIIVLRTTYKSNDHGMCWLILSID